LGDQVLGLVDIAIVVFYVVAAVLLWVGASDAYFDADPRRRSARQSRPDAARCGGGGDRPVSDPAS
jgi:nitrogen fixation-related uncharacterized protein